MCGPCSSFLSSRLLRFRVFATVGVFAVFLATLATGMQSPVANSEGGETFPSGALDFTNWPGASAALSTISDHTATNHGQGGRFAQNKEPVIPSRGEVARQPAVLSSSPQRVMAETRPGAHAAFAAQVPLSTPAHAADVFSASLSPSASLIGFAAESPALAVQPNLVVEAKPVALGQITSRSVQQIPPPAVTANSAGSVPQKARMEMPPEEPQVLGGNNPLTNMIIHRLEDVVSALTGFNESGEPSITFGSQAVPSGVWHEHVGSVAASNLIHTIAPKPLVANATPKVVAPYVGSIHTAPHIAAALAAAYSPTRAKTVTANGVPASGNASAVKVLSASAMVSPAKERSAPGTKHASATSPLPPSDGKPAAAHMTTTKKVMVTTSEAPKAKVALIASGTSTTVVAPAAKVASVQEAKLSAPPPVQTERLHKNVARGAFEHTAVTRPANNEDKSAALGSTVGLPLPSTNAPPLEFGIVRGSQVTKANMQSVTVMSTAPPISTTVPAIAVSDHAKTKPTRHADSVAPNPPPPASWVQKEGGHVLGKIQEFVETIKSKL
eukprot:TRINITY_DN6914_c0_g2_i1.p1 TRINITY_DN6914_c0_g2~~TRINITY_DN6914_c0_g2_i1.p1  ORF type:complete len:555 (-),score=59.60 TRINITY_DN6914_c0_g2_i1:66-1730(-)